MIKTALYCFFFSFSGEANGANESLKQSQRLLQQTKADNSEALGKIAALEKELCAFKDTKEEVKKLFYVFFFIIIIIIVCLKTMGIFSLHTSLSLIAFNASVVDSLCSKPLYPSG